MNKTATLIIAIVVSALSCKKKGNVNPDPIPNVPVSVTINIALPTYSQLQQPGSFAYVDGGVKGIVVVHHTDDQFYALDRCCSYQPSNSCSKVEVDSNFTVLRCGESKVGGFQKCCDSKFWMDGSVFIGPATFGLKHYQVIQTGNIIDIKN